MAAGINENTPEYLENLRKSRVKNKARYLELSLKHIVDHLLNFETLVPEQIKFIVTQNIRTLIDFETESIELFNNLPKSSQEELEHWYQENKQYKTIETGNNKKVPQEVIDSFYTRQEEIFTETRDLANSRISEENL